MTGATSTPSPLTLPHARDVLAGRPVRPHEVRTEVQALRNIATDLATRPAVLSQTLVDAAMHLTGAGSAGLSLNEDQGPEFRWVATAGEFKRYENETLPRDFSPCGLVLDTGMPLLMTDPVRQFPYIDRLHAPVCEVLLAPFAQDGELVGTVWVAHHGRDAAFDAEDLRLVESLTAFAGAAIHAIGQVSRLRDSHERGQQLLREAAESRRLMAQWFEQAPGFVALLRGPQYAFEMANRAYRELVGREDLIGRPVAEVLPETVDQGFIQLLDEVRSTGRPYIGREVLVQLLRQPGEPPRRLHLDFIYQPVFDAQGAVDSVFVQGHDVTERRRAMDLLTQADARKDEFLAVVAHEMRSPLSPIRVAAHVLRRQLTDPEHLRPLDIIDRQSTQLSALVDDLLDAASIRTGKVSLTLATVAVQDIIAKALEAAQPQIDRRRHELSVDMPGEPLMIQADPDRITQVVINLLANAAKYTPDGGRIQVSARAETGGVSVAVRDSGVGIAPDMLGQVFDMFMQLPDASRRQGGGLGIGLALVRQLVALHGGRVEAHSEGPGQGSTFRLWLPRGGAQPA